MIPHTGRRLQIIARDCVARAVAKNVHGLAADVEQQAVLTPPFSEQQFANKVSILLINWRNHCPPAAVAFWEVMAHIRWAVIGLQQCHRHLSGDEASLELALTGRMVAELEQELLALTAPERWEAA